MLFSCGNPFKSQFPKKNNASISPPQHISLLNDFETSLRVSITKLVPKDDDDKNDFLTVSWMIQAVHSLCETHQSIKTLVTDLDLPVSDLEESLMDTYSNITSKLLQLCNSFILELSRINDGNMLLKLAFSNPEELISLSHLESWRQHMASKNPRIENCDEVLISLAAYMNHYNSLYKKVKKKQSKKVKVLLRALYGVKVKTIYIFSVFAAAFSGSSKNIVYIFIPKDEGEEVAWEKAFMELQNMINPEIQNMFLSDRFTGIKDIEAVESCVEKLYAEVQEGSAPNMVTVMLLKQSVMDMSERFDILSKEARCLSETVITARDALFKKVWNKI